MSEFLREDRYTVLKNADIAAYLTDEDRELLDDLLRKINRHRLMEKREVLRCVVIEHDWPEYGASCAALELRIRQEQCDHEWRWHQIAGEGQICKKCYVRNFDCDD